MTRKIRALGLVLTVALGAGCVTGRLATREQPRPKLSERTHLIGHGESMEGAEQAKARARGDVCAQVRSQVVSVLVVEGRAGNGQDSDSVSETVRQTCEFKHNELIHVDPSVLCDDGHCTATAYMVRSEAASTLLDEYRRSAAGFRAAAAQALAATGDLAKFATAQKRADALWRETLAPLALELRVIAGGVLPEMQEDEQQHQALAAAATRALSSLRITVDLTQLPAADRDTLGNALLAALSSLGLAATAGSTCGDGLRLVPTATLACDRGYFGPQCKLSINGSLTSCSDGRELAPLAVTFTGAHPRDEASARREAVSQAAGAPLESALRDQLGSVLPVR